jgi:hypothetical protein
MPVPTLYPERVLLKLDDARRRGALLAASYPPGTAHRNALDRLRLDDAQAGLGPAARRAAASRATSPSKRSNSPCSSTCGACPAERASFHPHAGAKQWHARPPHRASPARCAAGPCAPASALPARRRSTTRSLSGARHGAPDALRSTSVPSVKPKWSLRDQIGIRHIDPLKQALNTVSFSRRVLRYLLKCPRHCYCYLPPTIAPSPLPPLRAGRGLRV